MGSRQAESAIVDSIPGVSGPPDVRPRGVSHEMSRTRCLYFVPYANGRERSERL